MQTYWPASSSTTPRYAGPVSFFRLPTVSAPDQADIALIEQGLEMYRLDMFTYPRSEEGLAALQTPPAGLAQPDRYRRGGYLKRLPDDPWGKPYQYALPGQHGAFDIYSLGADGAPGGTGENADIGNWK